MSDKPNVTQTRLAWQPGDVSEADPNNLEPHDKNTEIYGDTQDADDLEDNFVESISEKGVLEPIVVTKDKDIISGHRRWLAAKDVGLDTVPVRISEFDSELEEREALIEFNRQRDKTPGQIVNEFEEMLEIERERAREREETLGKNHGEDPSGNISRRGVARDKAAEKIDADVSGRTLEKGLEVKQKAESEDEPKDVRETARDAWEGLESGEESFNGAYQKVRNATDDEQTEDATDDLEVLTSQKSDEWSSPREIVEPLDAALDGFSLDPCSGAESSPFAGETFTEEDDGLVREWFGSVWVNPPYSDVGSWVDKSISEVESNAADVVVFLCKGDSSTDWWQRAAESCELVTAIDHRLTFGDGGNPAPFASHIFVFGKVNCELVDELSAFGTVLTRGWSDD